MARQHRDVSSKLCCPGAKPRRWTPPLVTYFDVIRRDNEDLIFALIWYLIGSAGFSIAVKHLRVQHNTYEYNTNTTLVHNIIETVATATYDTL